MIAIFQEDGVEISREVGRQLPCVGIHGALVSSDLLPKEKQCETCLRRDQLVLVFWQQCWIYFTTTLLWGPYYKITMSYMGKWMTMGSILWHLQSPVRHRKLQCTGHWSKTHFTKMLIVQNGLSDDLIDILGEKSNTLHPLAQIA